MTTTILLVGHGSRNQCGNREIDTIGEQWRLRHPDWRIELCFIELADRLLDEGLAAAAAGSQRVVVVPLILNAAGHVKMEIPHHIAKARLRFPEVAFSYARHLGASDAVLKILKRQLHKVMDGLDRPDPKTTGLILLGRGSSDRLANGEMAKMGRWLYEISQHELVDIAFTGITYPRLEQVVQRQVKLEMTQIVILPYYLFTGVLIERIGRQHHHLQQQYPQIRFALGNYFGFEEEIFQLLDQRVAEVVDDSAPLMMECDGCHYRASHEAADDGHHHS
ncbi:MAG: sirohydrochlorin chelatase [Gammaproteobacteria bacterium]|nr:sirohydrochlorin chelatase [Gammaproteobacteria bacterium]